MPPYPSAYEADAQTIAPRIWFDAVQLNTKHNLSSDRQISLAGIGIANVSHGWFHL